MERFSRKHFVAILFVFSFLNNSKAQSGLWTWVHGDSAYYTLARYGTRGIPDSSNVPPGLYATVFWTDHNGKFWIYGGKDYSSGYFSDMWMFDPDTRVWTWMKGDSGAVNQAPTFGIKGVSSPLNSPGCRGLGSPAWTDSTGNLWMYGGYTKQRTGSFPYRYMSDLWKYDIQTNEWTWMDGDSLPGNLVLGVKGVPAPTNSPGSLAECSDYWTDSENNFWFYGAGQDFYSAYYLWRYNPNTGDWTWMSGGTNFGNAHYGTKGVFDSLNCPGARFAHTSWQGNDGKFWLFGGSFDGLVYDQFLNDLWCYDPQINQWAWYAGDDSLSDIAHYGPECHPGDSLTPGNGIEGRAAWIDDQGNLWKFGGKYEVPGNAYTLNQSLLWCFVMADKKWMLVNSPVPDPSFSLDAQRRFGVLGQADINSHPGARCGTASFKDRNGVFYMFGGLTKVPVTGMDVTVNDMWSYEPDPSCLQLAGINENKSSEEELIVFPNPANQVVHIEQIKGLRYSHIELMNIHGQVVMYKNAGLQTELNLQNMAPGIYYLILHNHAENKYLKLIVQ